METVTLPTLGIDVGSYLTAGLGVLTAALGAIIGVAIAFIVLRLLLRRGAHALAGKL